MTTYIRPKPVTLAVAVPADARCGACQWRGNRKQLIWVKGRYACFFRCPECHSDNVSISFKVRQP